MSGELTVSERIMYLLHGYVKYEDKYEVPFDVTQDGISQACGISRAHAAIELKKLKAAGLIAEHLSHVRKGKTRRKAYFLSFEGKNKATDIAHYVKENGLDPMVDPSKVSPEQSIRRLRTARRSSPLPQVARFFGREKELRGLLDDLASPSHKVICVRGIAGIGKTTLVAKAVSELSGQRVFWHAVKPWDAPRTLADSLGGFFAENGSKALSSYLAAGKFELGEISFMLEEELAENGFTLVFDDVDSNPQVQEFLSMLRHSCGCANILVTAEERPGFYEPSDVVARKEIHELELAGLDREAALELLGARGITGPVAEQLVRLTKGHPLSLEMVTEATPEGAHYQVSRYFEEKFYSTLQEPERSLLQFASVFEGPFPAGAIPRDLRAARKGSMLREVTPGMLEIHASLRNFVYGTMTREERTKWHSAVADYFLRENEPNERLAHLLRAGRQLEAEMMMARAGDSLLDQGNIQRLWDLVSSFEPRKPRYASAVTLLKARAANMAGEYETSWSLLEELSTDEAGPFRAEALIEMGRIKSKKGDLAGASRLLSDALNQVSDAPATRARALRGLGVVMGKLGNYARAQELLEGSAREALSAMDTKGMLLAHLELGNVFIGRGRYEQAIDHFTKCAAGFGPVDLTNVNINMGIACAHLGRLDEARVHLENAVRLAEETGQPRSLAYALTSLAEVLLRVGDVDQAREGCFRALEVFTGLEDRMGMSAAYANLGNAERAAGNLHSSEEYFSESLSSLEGMDVPRSLGLRKLEFGLILAEKGDRERALRLLEESRAHFEGIDAEDLLKRVELELKRLSKSDP